MAGEPSWAQIVRDIPRQLPTANSADAKWGVFSVLFSAISFLISLAFAFWAVSLALEEGRMIPSSIVSWVFLVAAVLSLVWAGTVVIYTLPIAKRWYVVGKKLPSPDSVTNSKIDDVARRVDDLSTGILSLVNEIRQERNERHNRESADYD